MYLLVDTEPEDNDWPSVIYEEVFDNRPNLWCYGDDNWFEVAKSKITVLFLNPKFVSLNKV